MTALFILFIILLLAFAGFLAGSEAALTSISRVMVEQLENRKGGRSLRRVIQDPARYLNVVLLVRKAAELTATVLLAVIMLDHWPWLKTS